MEQEKQQGLIAQNPKSERYFYIRRAYDPYFAIMEFSANSIAENCDADHEPNIAQERLLGEWDLLNKLVDMEVSLDSFQRNELVRLPLLQCAKGFGSLPNDEKEKWHKKIADIISGQPQKRRPKFNMSST